MKKTSNGDHAASAWGAPPPDWIAALADACDREGQRLVAKRLGYGVGVVNGVLGKKYKGRYDRIEAKVRDRLMRPAAPPEPEDRSNVGRVFRCWPGMPPAWVLELAKLADRHGQSEAGKLIGYTGSVVNQVLGNKYTGRLDRIKAIVGGRFLGARVNCPAFGDLSASACETNQRRKLDRSNIVWIQLAEECPKCVNWRGTRKPEERGNG